MRDPYVRWCERRTSPLYAVRPSTRLAVGYFAFTPIILNISGSFDETIIFKLSSILK